ncbi:MAG: M28 family peptidase [Bacteroidota bacterium]
MKKIIIIIVLFIACISQSDYNVEKITPEEMKTIVGYLAADEINGRDTGTEGIEKSATYIEKYFQEHDIEPYYETYRDTFRVKELPAFNVLGVIEGNDSELKDEFILIGAHYDHIGNRAKIFENDSIANGANDNASGTATAMTIAKHFATTRSNKRSIIVTLFSAEEMGLRGSRHLAQRMKSDSLNLYAMVNFEMTGVPFKDRPYQAYVTGFSTSNMVDKINEYVGDTLIGKSDVAVKYGLFKRSDNYPFYSVFKIPSQTISSCDLTNYDYYHKVDDEADKMDYEHMASLVNNLIPAIEAMANSKTREVILNNEE